MCQTVANHVERNSRLGDKANVEKDKMPNSKKMEILFVMCFFNIKWYKQNNPNKRWSYWDYN